MALQYEMLPTVKEMLCACPRERIVDSLVSRHGSVGDCRRERLRLLYEEVLKRMGATQARGADGIVVVPRVRFECNPSLAVERTVQATCVDVKGTEVRSGGISSWPWERVLSFRVWPGVDSCVKDRYDLIVDVCWRMASSGTTAEEVAWRLALRAGEPLGVLGDDQVDASGIGWGGSDLVDEEYREMMGDLVKGWNADADIAFCAEVMTLRHAMSAA